MSTWEASQGVVEFPDGRRIRGRGLRKNPLESVEPEFGVYLLGRDPKIECWASRWVRWRDFRLPDSTDEALLAMLSGVAHDEALSWVREHYHQRAVETRGQRRWIAEVAALLGTSSA